jgi:thiamine-phosphate pyrophosphorylase
MICLVSDRRRLSSKDDALDRLVEIVGAAARAGVDLIQIRERDLSAAGLTALVRRCVAAVDGTRSKVLVNDRADVALAAGAHGVHLRADSVPASSVARLLAREALVGRSVHSLEEAVASGREGCVDYLVLGTMFQTSSKEASQRLATLEELAHLAIGIPVLAIGGMTVERAAVVSRAGAAGIAGIGLFIPPDHEDPDRYFQTLVAALRRAFDTCEAVS